MSTVAASFVGSDLWNAEVYGTLSVASRTTATIKNAQHLLHTRWSYMRLNRHMDTLLESFYSIFDRAQRGALTPAKENATPEQIQKSVESLWNLHHSVQCVYDLSVRKGLKKKILLSAQVEQLAQSKERLLDVIQWVTEMSNPEDVRAIDDFFNMAAEELERGETVTVP